MKKILSVIIALFMFAFSYAQLPQNVSPIFTYGAYKLDRVTLVKLTQNNLDIFMNKQNIRKKECAKFRDAYGIITELVMKGEANKINFDGSMTISWPDEYKYGQPEYAGKVVHLYNEIAKAMVERKVGIIETK